MLRNYFKIAFRRLWADKTNTAINVLGLTLGITCCLVIYIFVQYEFSFDGFHTNADRIYRIVEHNQNAEGVEHWPTTAYPLAEAIRQELPDVGVTQTAGPTSRLITSIDRRGVAHRFEEKRVLFADANYLHTFDFATIFTTGLWLAGNAQTAFQEPNAVVLTQKLTERYFAGYTGHPEQVLGKTLLLNKTSQLVVTGVIRNPPPNTNLLFDMLVNYTSFKANNQYQATNWSGNYEGTTYVTLAAGADPKRVEGQLQQLQTKYMKPEDIRRISYVLQPLTDIHTETLYGSSLGSYVVSRGMLWGLVSLAIFLILIASFNFINLTTAQAIRRRKEVGVRKVIGSTQAQLFGQFIGETLLVAFVAGLLSLAALSALLSWVNQSLTVINLNLSADATIWAFSAGLILVVAMLAGFYPAIILSRFQPITALKNTVIHRGDRFSLRQGLIVLQFCITYGLLVCTFVASRQMNFFKSKELGFTKDAVITLNGPRNQVGGKVDIFRQQLLLNPAIREVSFSSGAPITSNFYGTKFRLKSESVQMSRMAEEKFVDLPYQSLFDLKLLNGRWFSPSNRLPEGLGFNAFIVNETMVRMLGLTPETALGKTVVISEGEAPIIGVVKNFHNVSLQQPIMPCLLIYQNSGFAEQIHIQLQTHQSQLLYLPQTLGFIGKTWQQLFPDDVYQFTFLNESLAKNYLIEQLVFDAFRIFAGISIFISCLGLFGLITFAANQRTKEIGVRKVLGASVVSIVALLSGDFLKLVMIAIVITTPVAWYAMSRWLQDFAYKIDIEWWVFALASLLAVGIALLTVSFQSVRAALMNPVKSLRSE